MMAIEEIIQDLLDAIRAEHERIDLLIKRVEKLENKPINPQDYRMD